MEEPSRSWSCRRWDAALQRRWTCSPAARGAQLRTRPARSLRGVPLTAWARRAPVANPPHRGKSFLSLFLCWNRDFRGSTEFPPGNTTTTCRIPSGGYHSLLGQDAHPWQAPLTTTCRIPSGGYHSLRGNRAVGVAPGHFAAARPRSCGELKGRYREGKTARAVFDGMCRGGSCMDPTGSQGSSGRSTEGRTRPPLRQIPPRRMMETSPSDPLGEPEH